MNIDAVGLLSPGDMGHVVGRVLIGHGMPVLTCLRGRSERTRLLTRRAGIQAVPKYEDLVRDTDLVLSILVPAEAMNAARNVVTALRDTGEAVLYADCNAVSPATARRLGTLITGAGSRFASASIIGPPPRLEGTTRFYASGSCVEEFEALADYGLDIRALGSELGQAKSIKMSYGALTKGLTAISTQLLIAARRAGVYDALVEEFKTSQASLYKRMERALPVMPSKSRRWVGEMEEIAGSFEALGLTPRTYQGAADTYTLVGRTQLADETPETLNRDRALKQVIEALAEKK